MKAYKPIPLRPVFGTRQHQGGEGVDPSRRDFLRYMAASLALAGAGCSGPPPENILPYVHMPEALLPGQPAFYASTLVRGGYGLGVLVECNQGRPTKVEGNPRHPASLGATDVFAQAALLQFWDPDRSSAPWFGGQPAAWREAEAWLAARGAALRDSGGEGLRVLSGNVTSAAWLAQWQALQRRFPKARRHSHEPLHDADAARSSTLAFGRSLPRVLRPERARILVSFADDFLGNGPGAVAYGRSYAQQRRDPRRPSRLYVVEPLLSLTGANADERLALHPSRMEAMIWRLGHTLGLVGNVAPADADPRVAAWEAALIQALRQHPGESLVLAGPGLSAPTRALVFAMNQRLGNLGRSLYFIAPPEQPADSLDALVADMSAGRVDSLLILDANPVYDAPADLDFAGALARVPHTLHAGLYRDETGERCIWHLPLAHDFEHWSDALAFDGTRSIVQPVIRPLYNARSSRHILSLLDLEQPSDEQALQAALQGQGAADDKAWKQLLREGAVIGGPAPAVTVVAARPIKPPSFTRPTLTVVYSGDSSVGDGRYANNGWLQELPRPVTKLVWDNAALLAPATAQAHGLHNGDLVDLDVAGRRLNVPIWTQPGQAEETVGLALGYGRWAAGRVGNGVGCNAYRLKGRDWLDPVSLRATGQRHEFVCMQEETSMHDRPLVHYMSVAERKAGSRRSEAETPPDHSLYPPFSYPDHAWAMAIDLNACIGCGACTIACQAENNIPVVGKEQAGLGRAMHWIRVDRYWDEPGLGGGLLFQPVPCMHCEDAPCEPVCPVGATMHDSEGLNVQVYNRCVGTRYCSNNCPYKVRRFNFLQYSDTVTESLKAGRNPEVTVRRQGVMEKCNYCLQRITRARIAAEEAGRPMADGDVVTACQAVCPTQAIVFGDLKDPRSRVNQAKASPLDYAMLAELNTRPRTSYGARVLNPDPALSAARNKAGRD